jgi:glycosyltransferase involved in cell wall biosynthesis
MEIVLCHHYSLSFGAGGEKFLFSAAKELVKRGHEVEVRALPIMKKRNRFSQVVKYLSELGVEYQESWLHRVKGADVVYLIYAPIVHKLFKCDAPKIAGIHGFPFAIELQHEDVKGLNALKLARKVGVLPTAALTYFKAFGKRELKGFNAVHVINKAMISFYDHEKTYYVPLWVDCDFYKPIAEKKEQFTALFLGRQEWAKGFDTYIKVAEMLKGKGVEFLSTGKSAGPVKGLNYVPEEDLPHVISSAHVIVLPSRIDTFGLSIVEALSCGTPVITTLTQAHKELELPLLYANTLEEFGVKILELKDLWERRREEYYALSKAVREEALKYDVDKVFPKFERMLVEVARGSA